MLKVKDLNVHYGQLHILKNISLNINEGELVTLIGANGAGKTTLLMTLSGVVRSSSGSIDFKGKIITKSAPHVIIRMGMVQVPQNRLLFPDMTVSENLELGACRYIGIEPIEQKKQRIYGYFDILEKRRHQKAGTLSGGEQQMLAIGRSLMANPKLLLLDEPSSGLAPIIVDRLAEMISHLNQNGLSILLVEQNAYLALELADRAYILQTGSIISTGKASEYLESEIVRQAYLGK